MRSIPSIVAEEKLSVGPVSALRDSFSVLPYTPPSESNGIPIA